MGHFGDIQFSVHKGVNLDAHWHSEVELLFVIDGALQVTVGDHATTLSQEDLMLVNSGITHQVTGEDTLFCIVKYPWHLLSQMLGQESRMFVCNSAEDRERSYAEMRTIFRKLIVQYVRPERRTDCLIDSLILQMLDELVEHFQVVISDDERDRLSSDLRLQRMIQFVNHSYQHNLSLTKMAEDLQVSTSTLSRFFKKKTGYYFVDYVNQVRVQAAMKELVDTDHNITMIAVNSGFSNLTVFNNVFRDINGCSPTEYRRMRRDAYQDQQRRMVQATEELRAHLRRTLGQEFQPSSARLEQITADGRSGKLYQKGWNRAINMGSAYQMTQTNLQSHLLYLKEQIDFRYARIWNVFARGLMITDGQRVSACNFDMLDDVLDVLVKHHITPFLDLGKRPNTITRNENEVVFQEYETIEFSSRRVWEYLVHSFVRHVVKRYGKEEVGGWIFELTYIPSGKRADWLYDHPDGEWEYADAFQYLYQVLREYAPRAKVGGSGAVMDFRPQWQREVLSELVSRGCLPDFYSVVVYPYESQKNTLLARRTRDEDWEEKQVAAARGMLDEVGLQQCSLYICEWNHSLSNRNYLNDSCYRSAYMAQKVSAIWDRVELMAVSIGSDWVDNHYDTYRIVNGNMGLLSQFNIRKPAFYAMQFLNALGDYIISRGTHYIITRTNHYSYYILCFNRIALGESYYLMPEDSPLPNQVDSLFDDGEPLELELVLEQMPEGRIYTVKRRSINQQEGSILPEWGRFHYENRLEVSDIRYLGETCFPRMSMERVTVSNGVLHIKEVLQPNEVTLLHVYEHVEP